MMKLLAGLLTAWLFAPSVQAQEPFTVLFLGDSLTSGYGLDEGQSFPSLLEQRFKEEGRNIRVLNAGVSGSTTASGLSRLQWYGRSNPDLLVLSLGANDGLRGLSVEDMRANLSAIIEYAHANAIKVALTGMLVPPNMGPEYSSNFAAVFPALAEQYDLPLLPFLLEGVAAVPEFNQPDGIHPNLEGTQRVADLVYAFLLPLLP
ncbi:MAG TPA: arylesterase [Pseudomonadaceae bacterium]|nr:arylesterase [Pseudomonadaceae bacterium]